MTNQPLIPTKYILNAPITALRFEEQMFLMLKWARSRESRMVCLANVHMLMEAHQHQEFASLLREADLVTPDGMPLVWMLRKLGVRGQDRVAGMDVFLRLCQLSSLSGVSIYFVGSHAEILERMRVRLEREFPNLKIAGMAPLPFKPLTPSEDNDLIQKINASGAGIVWVCLGCPKQEQWMLKHLGKINAVMLGVGAVFSLYAGVYTRAPRFIRESGFEWLYRLTQEPTRLWNRYSQTIPPFLWLASKQLLTQSRIKLSELEQEKTDSLNSSLDFLSLDSRASKIGEILVRQNIISDRDLFMALEEQHSSQRKLGEILIDRGYISVDELEYYLKNQKVKLGELLVENSAIAPNRLERLLSQQKLSRKKLGELLIEKDILSTQQLQEFLREQYWRHHGLWLMDETISESSSYQWESLSLGS
jgi:N-acetylglucosaminyldiphosphoundecaprenol N-acetyl-beta-D-mannosaminyltransferase